MSDASTDTGWTDTYPHKADAGDEYYFVRRKDRNEVVVMGFSMGKAWLNGVSYEPSELRSHLFLGPLKPEDVEQLSELRKALSETIVGEDGLRDILSRTFHSPQFSADVYALDVRRLTRTVLALRHAALAARDCLTTSRQGFTEWPEADAILEQLRAALNPQPEKETQGK